MSKSLVIAEKPSVAQDIVRALTPVAGKFDKHDDYFENAHYLVTSAVGHLVEIQAPEAYDVKRGKWSFAHLPVIPPHFDLKPVDKTKSRLNAVVKLARRKDVTDLFLGTGLGPRSYAIIEQGTVSRLVESRPADLKLFMEEAAGVSRYKERRRETEQRIRHTQENLERLDTLPSASAAAIQPQSPAESSPSAVIAELASRRLGQSLPR